MQIKVQPPAINPEWLSGKARAIALEHKRERDTCVQALYKSVRAANLMLDHVYADLRDNCCAALDIAEAYAQLERVDRLFSEARELGIRFEYDPTYERVQAKKWLELAEERYLSQLKELGVTINGIEKEPHTADWWYEAHKRGI